MTHALDHQAQVRAEWRRHWPLVLSAGFAVSFTAVTTAIMGLFIEPWSQEFGWSRALISSGLSVSAVAGFFLAPFGGMLIDRIGTRRMALPGLVVLASALAALSTLNGSVALWFAIWTLMAVGNLATQPTLWTAGVASSFEAGRGLALGLTLTGSAVAQATAPFLTNLLIEEFGWRTALVCLAAGWGGTAFVLCYFLFYSGYDTSMRAKAANGAAVPAKPLLDDAPGLSIAEAVRSVALWRIAISTLLTMIVTMAIVVHQIPILLGIGVTRQAAVLYAGMAAIAGIFGKLITGWLLDRFPARWVGGLTLSANVVTFILLLLPNPSAGIVFAAMFINGYTLGTKLQISSYLTSAYAGMRNFGAIFGVMASLIGIGSGVGPLLGGLIYDRYGSYDPYLWVAIGGTLISALLIFGLPGYPAWVKRRPRKGQGFDSVQPAAPAGEAGLPR